MSQSPLWPVVLSHRLPVDGLVSRYLTNYLMGRKPIHWWPKPFVTRDRRATTCGISSDFSGFVPASG